MKPQKMKNYFNIFFIAIFLFTSCNKEDTAISPEGIESEIDFEYYKIDLNKSYTDLSNDKRFKNLTPEQILVILEYYSPDNTVTSKQNCGNCVAYVIGKDSRLMPVDSGCNVHYKWTDTSCLKGKMKLINTCTPVVGSAVIMDTGISAGHVGYVEKIVRVHDGYSIKVSNGNWGGECKTLWFDTGDFRIKGYQDPNRSINCSNEPFANCNSPYSSC